MPPGPVPDAAGLRGRMWFRDQTSLAPAGTRPVSENERQLRDNARSYTAARRSPPPEGPALLRGLAICGVCGRNMTVRYHTRNPPSL